MFFTGDAGVFLMFYPLYGAVSYGYRHLGWQQRRLQQLSRQLSQQRGAACAISAAEVLV
jgi:hypothetical protein